MKIKTQWEYNDYLRRQGILLFEWWLMPYRISVFFQWLVDYMILLRKFDHCLDDQILQSEKND